MRAADYKSGRIYTHDPGDPTAALYYGLDMAETTANLQPVAGYPHYTRNIAANVAAIYPASYEQLERDIRKIHLANVHAHIQRK